MQRDDIWSRINKGYPKFSKGQKKIADYIKAHSGQVGFMTAARLGKAVGASESTVVRFASELGYSGYPEFRSALENVVMDRLDSVSGLGRSVKKYPEDQLLERVLTSDIENIRYTIEHCDRSVFHEAADTILSAKRVFVIGIRSCAPLAQFLYLYLNQIVDDAKLVATNSVEEIFEQLIGINEDDVLIAVSFPRYSMRTLKAIEFANSRNARIINITDSMHSPMNLYSSCNLLAKSGMISFVDSLTAPMSVINALLAALYVKREDVVTKRIAMMEDLWDEYQVYTRDELEPVPGELYEEKRKNDR